MFKKATVLFLSAALLAGSAGALTLSERYSFAGAVNPWYVEESYYASPLVVDLDGDGKLEVLTAAHSIAVMDAATGALKWRVNSGKDRSTPFTDAGNTARQVFPDLQVADVDGDGGLEIVAGYADGSVSVLDKNGYFKPGWPQNTQAMGGIRAVATADLDGDGKREIIVGAGTASPVSVWVYRADGTLAPGWPQLSDANNANVTHTLTDSAYSYGVFGNGISTSDLDGDGLPELIVPTDTPYINAYNYDGSLVSANSRYGGRAWGKVALWEDYAVETACENEGWGWSIDGSETRKDLYRAELGHAGTAVADVDGDGVEEIAVTALIIDRTNHTKTNRVTTADSRYMTVFLLNKDRSRYVNQSIGADWSAAPRDLGGPLKKADAESVVTGVLSEPVCADLDGDGNMEILFNSYNGKLHCFALDGAEHGSWPYVMPQTGGGRYEYATPPACADLDGDGKQEVVFASWIGSDAGNNTGVNGALYVLDHTGKLLTSRPLHDGYSTYEGVIHNSNNVFAAPTLADVDGDGKLEILLNTTYYGLCVYDVASAPLTAAPSPAPVVLDGTPITLNAYNRNDTTYVMLRDIAFLLQDTGSKFSVDWDGATGTIDLALGQKYVPTGTELQGKGAGAKPFTAGTGKLSVNGGAVSLDALLIEGNYYFKLRDLGKALGFGVDWDGTNVILQSGR